MPKNKHWLLLANAFYDRTQLHNATAFEMARLTDFPWVQSGRFVELILNGKHLGLYYLCEKIRLGKNRIDIEEIEPTDLDGDALTGGYLLETVVADQKENSFVTDYFNSTGEGFAFKLGWALEHPDDNVPEEQLKYIHAALNDMENLIYYNDSLLTGKYRAILDIESAINWFLVEEVALNEESSRTKDLYLYKIRRGKFCVGPPWDFDAYTFGVWETDKHYCTETSFYYRQLLKDPVFVQRLKEKWHIYKEVWQNRIPEFIDSQYKQIEKAAQRNDKMWPNWHKRMNPQDKDLPSMIKEMKATFVKQLLFVDNYIKTL